MLGEAQTKWIGLKFTNKEAGIVGRVIRVEWKSREKCLHMYWTHTSTHKNNTMQSFPEKKQSLEWGEKKKNEVVTEWRRWWNGSYVNGIKKNYKRKEWHWYK